MKAIGIEGALGLLKDTMMTEWDDLVNRKDIIYFLMSVFVRGIKIAMFGLDQPIKQMREK